MHSPVKNRELISSNGDRSSTQSIHQFSEDDNFDGKNEYFENDLLSPNAKSPHEESSQNSKPRYSFITMISKAILSKKNRKMVLQDIYQYIMNTFPFYNNKEKAWRNSVRHNLSINECFIKMGRSGNGKGNFWSIHPAYIDDFIKGDFRLRQARHRTRQKMVRGPSRYNCWNLPLTRLPNALYQSLLDRPIMHDSYESQQRWPSLGHEMNLSIGELSKRDNIFLPFADYEKLKKPFEYEQHFLQFNSPYERYKTSVFDVFPNYCQYKQ
ncbi:unnamed protein product [Mytilus edulis]|uniref:Fork-head domain-containing protein n=1 Tax=Mytilus edulis TaxID=6550 RepID=A0A8S3QQV7_MYTED|nr:unnamed protein product [Mytilus edulis]